ncbi:MAG: methicillin resistance protein, partial [candidate division KSB1 bacterium]|nr:methicillin resistance protein [candidate division KSB1 bacterium]
MSGPRRLSARYAVSVCPLRRHEWDAVVADFADLTVYQTWAYGAVRWGEQNITHLLLRRSGKIVAAAQARLFRAPMLGLGVAYVRYGPLFRNGATEETLETFRQAVRALRNEFVCARRLILRLNVNLWSLGNPEPYKRVLVDEGFRPAPFIPPLRTLVVDLRPTLEELRANLLQRWRNNLNQAERRFGVAVRSGT